MAEIVCYHGTSQSNATSILREGFHADSWWATGLQDAIAFGGDFVFEVLFDPEQVPPSAWQFHHLGPIGPERIIALKHWSQKGLYKKALTEDAIS